MKWFAIVIFIVAAAAGVYILTQGQTPPSKTADKQTEKIDAEMGTLETGAPQKATSADEAFPQASAGRADKESKPQDAKKEGDKTAAVSKDAKDDGSPPTADSRRRRRRDAELSANPGGETPGGAVSGPSPASNSVSGSDVSYLSRYQNPYAPQVAPAPSAATASASDKAASANGSGAGLALGTGPLIGGFAFPAAVPASTANASATPASKPATNANSAASPKNNATTVAALPRNNNVLAAQPLMAGEKKLPPESVAIRRPLDIGNDLNNPAMADKYTPPDAPSPDFVGIYVSPKSFTLPAGADAEKKLIAVTSQKSGFGPQDKPTIELSKECDLATVTAACETSIPDGGPSIAGYLSGNIFMKEDQVPDTKTFEIGTTTLGAPKDPETGKETSSTEISAQIDPGKVPGRYTVRVTNASQKSYTAVFEILPAPVPQQIIQAVGAEIVTPPGNLAKPIKTQTPP